jgi:glucose-6-phosphate isomerase
MISIRYDPSGVFTSPGGLSRAEFEELAPRLVAARDEVLADAKLWASGRPVPPEKKPLDAGFMELPERLLEELKETVEVSEVARLRAAADRLAGAVWRRAVTRITTRSSR